MAPKVGAQIELVDATKEFVQLQAERLCQDRKGSKAGFLPSQFEVGDVVLIDACVLGKVELTPATRLPQFANSLPEQDANISRHPYYRRVKAKVLIPTIVGTEHDFFEETVRQRSYAL